MYSQFEFPMEEAKRLIGCGQYTEAEKILEYLISTDTCNKVLYLELAKCNLAKDKYKAIESLEKYIYYGGNDSKAMILLLKLYVRCNLIDKARDILNDICDKDDDYYEEAYSIYMNFSDFDSAFFSIQKIKKTEKREELAACFLQECICKEYYEFIKKIILDECIRCDNKNYYLFRYYKSVHDYAAELEQIKYIQQNNDLERYEEINVELVFHSTSEWFFNSEKDILLLINEICFFIDYDDTDSDIIRALSVILRKKKINSFKDKILDILEKFYSASTKPRAKNIFLSELEILQKKTVLKSKPRQIIAELTTACNLKCLMCNVHTAKRKISDNMIDFVKDCIPSAERIKWQGGEVFLYDGFSELSQMCNKYGTKQIIQTNGHLINQERLNFLSSENIHLSFSIDSPDKKTYEKIRNGAKFEKLIEVLELCKENKKYNPEFKFTVIIVVMALNYMQLDAMIDFAFKYGFSGITFQKYRHHGDDRLLLTPEQKKYVVLKVKEIMEKYKDTDFDVLTSIPLNGSYENEIDVDDGFYALEDIPGFMEAAYNTSVTDKEEKTEKNVLDLPEEFIAENVESEPVKEFNKSNDSVADKEKSEIGISDTAEKNSVENVDSETVKKSDKTNDSAADKEERTEKNISDLTEEVINKNIESEPVKEFNKNNDSVADKEKSEIGISDTAEKNCVKNIDFEAVEKSHETNDSAVDKEERAENKVSGLPEEFIAENVESEPIKESDENNDSVSDKSENFNMIHKDSLFEKIDPDMLNDKICSECNLYCAAPWTEAVCTSADVIMLGAGSAGFDVSKCSGDSIWNNKGIVEYRKRIIENDFSVCNNACRNREDDSTRIRLGLIM